jgi:hypothetical protein
MIIGSFAKVSRAFLQLTGGASGAEKQALWRDREPQA